LASDVDKRIAEIKYQVECEQVNNKKPLEPKFRAELYKFHEQRKRDEERRRRIDTLMAERLQAAEEKLRTAKSSDAQTMFDTEIEQILKFHIHTPSREMMAENQEQAIHETSGNNNPPPQPKGHNKENCQDNHKTFNYIKYYLNLVQGLGRDNPEYRRLAVAIINKQQGVVFQVAALNRSLTTLAEKPTNKALQVFNSRITSEFSS
jgi:hypothetical protein